MKKIIVVVLTLVIVVSGWCVYSMWRNDTFVRHWTLPLTSLTAQEVEKLDRQTLNKFVVNQSEEVEFLERFVRNLSGSYSTIIQVLLTLLVILFLTVVRVVFFPSGKRPASTPRVESESGAD